MYAARELELYDGEDVFDVIRAKHLGPNGELLNNFTYEEFVDNFQRSVIVVNSRDKAKRIKKYMRENPNGSNLETVDFYQFYKDGKF